MASVSGNGYAKVSNFEHYMRFNVIKEWHTVMICIGHRMSPTLNNAIALSPQNSQSPQLLALEHLTNPEFGPLISYSPISPAQPFSHFVPPSFHLPPHGLLHNIPTELRIRIRPRRHLPRNLIPVSSAHLKVAASDFF